MAKRISAAFVESMLNQLDIVSVIQSRIPLKKKGKDFEACCPFHEEKTPSFKVSPIKQIYHCFGSCGISGNLIGFVMRYDNLGFVDAVERIADGFGLQVIYEDEKNSQKLEKTQDLYGVSQTVSQFYTKQLDSANGVQAQTYLKARGVDADSINQFGLGYAPDGNVVLNQLSPRLSSEKLYEIGAIGRSDRGHYYDMFRDRLIFPIRDVRGRAIAFGARTMGDAQPKYLNTGETPLFSKRFVLYGLYEALQATRKIEQLIVVEGYLDVVALHQHGVQGAVATLGTALTKEHIELLRKYSRKIVICFDGDNAGKNAAERAALNILPFIELQDELRIVLLPAGDDPDSLVRKIGKPAFETLLKEGERLSDYIYRYLLANCDLSYPEGRGQAIARGKQLFDGLAQTEYKTLLYQGFVSKLGMDIYQLPEVSKDIFNHTAPSSLGALSFGKRDELTRMREPLAGNRYGFQRTALTSLIRLLLDMPSLAHDAEHIDLLLADDHRDSVLLGRLLQYLQYHEQMWASEDVGELAPLNIDFSIFSPEQRLRLTQIYDSTKKSEASDWRKEFIDGLTQLINKKLRKSS